MPDRFAVAAGNWGDTSTWSTSSGGAPGASVPTASDNAFLDAATGAVTITVNVSATCLDLDCTGFTGTLAGTSALAVSGSLILGAGMTRTYTGAITFNSTGAETVDSNGVALDSDLTFNGVGGSWALGAAGSLVTGATRAVTLTAGSIDLGGEEHYCGAFTSSGSGVRAITSNGGVRLTSVAATTVWNTGTATNLTIDPGIEVQVIGAAATTRTVIVDSSAGVFALAINAAGATVALGSDAEFQQFAVVDGTLDLNGYDAGVEVASALGTSTIDLGEGTLTVTSTGLCWAIADTATIIAGTSTIEFTDPDVTFAGGDQTYNVVEFARGGTIAIEGDNTFDTLRLNP